MQFWLDLIDQVDFCVHSKPSNGSVNFVSSSMVNNFSFSKPNVLSLVVFVAGITNISFVNLKTSLRWLCTFRFCKVSVTERMHILPSRFVQYSCEVSNCTWNLFYILHIYYYIYILSHIAITSLYSWMKILPLAAFNKRFSSLTYVLRSFWSNRSSIVLMIQSEDSKYILL